MAMFKDAIDAYVREDVQLARAVVPRDQALDEMNASAQPASHRADGGRSGTVAWLSEFDFYFARRLERVGDHATNMAEDAVYAAAAEDIRHQQVRRHGIVLSLCTLAPSSRTKARISRMSVRAREILRSEMDWRCPRGSG